MDANRFDAVSRAVGAQPDRRGLLKSAAVGGLGLLGLAAGGDVALAKRCNNNNDCNNNQICKKNKCKTVQCKNSGDCGKNKKCKNNKCKKKNKKK